MYTNISFILLIFTPTTFGYEFFLILLFKRSQWFFLLIKKIKNETENVTNLFSSLVQITKSKQNFWKLGGHVTSS